MADISMQKWYVSKYFTITNSPVANCQIHGFRGSKNFLGLPNKKVKESLKEVLNFVSKNYNSRPLLLCNDREDTFVQYYKIIKPFVHSKGHKFTSSNGKICRNFLIDTVKLKTWLDKQ